MAFPAFESRTEAFSATDVTSLSLPYPAGISAGDDLVIALWVDRDGATGSSASGFTLLEEAYTNAGSGSIYGALLHKVATGSESGNVTVNLGSAVSRACHALMYRISGGDESTTPPTSAGESPGAASLGAAGNILDNGDDYLGLYLGCMDAGPDAWSAYPSGSTGIHHENDNAATSVAAAEKDITGDGASTEGDEAWTWIASRDCIAFFIAIKGAAGASPQNLTAGAPAASTAAVTSPALSQNLTPGAPAASTAAVTSPSLAQVQEIVAGAPGASTASVGSHTIASDLVITAGAPAASTAAVTSPALSMAITAGVPGASTSAVGSHVLSMGGIDLSSWVPVAGHSAYEWAEGAAWTDVDIAVDLGLTEASPDIAPAIKAHMDANSGSRIRYIIPAGTWNLITLLHCNRDQKRLIGSGSGQTIINIAGAGVIRFQGFDGSVSAITTAPSRGDTTVQVADASIAAVGETITIRQDLDATVTGVDDNTSPYALGTITPETWAAQAWEQIVEVTAVDTGTDVITFTPALALDYDLGKNPEVKRYNNVFDSGIEGVTINVTVDNGLNALEFDRVRQCLARDVVINDHAKMGIRIAESYEVEVDSCVVDGARDTGTGGNGYGIAIELGSSRIYVHDCAVRDQRHAFLIQGGSSHCIIAYCYSATPSVENLTDLSIHGHNVHHNLVEGCIFHGVVEINDFYTETQANLVFRNRILGNASFWDADSRPYAFWVRRNSEVALVGNRCETTSVARIFAGSEGSLVLLNGNVDAPTGLEDSMYLSAKPASWGAEYIWPPFAGDEVNTIPAEALLLQTIAAGAPAASTAAVIPAAISQEIAAGAPATSTSGVVPGAVSQNLATGAPAASTASVGSHTLTQALEIVAGPPATSTTAVGAHTLTSQIVASAPATATASVTAATLSQSIAAGVPAASESSVLTSPALGLSINAGAPAASTADVGNHVVSFDLTVAAGPPAASTASVTSPALTQNLVAGAPAASTAAVGTHGIAIVQGLVAGAPAASTAAVASPVLSQQLSASAPAASSAGVTSPALTQGLTAGAPASSTADVVPGTLTLNLVATAPGASTATVISPALVLSQLGIVAGPPAASTAAVGSHTLLREGIPNQLAVTVEPAADLTVTAEPAATLTVTAYPTSGMGTKIQSGELVTFTGTFKDHGVPTTATGQVDLRIQHPDGTVTVVEDIAQGATGVYSTSVRLWGGGRHYWRMGSLDGRGIAQGHRDVEKNSLATSIIYPSVIIGGAEVVAGASIAIV